MTDLARSRGDQLIDLLGEYTEADDQPEAGYRRRTETDWLSEFADEERPAVRSAPDEVLLFDRPVSLQLEPEGTAPARSSRFTALALMVLLAAVSTSIVLITPITRPGDLPDVHKPVLVEAAVPEVPPAPVRDAVTRAPRTTTLGPISPDPGRSPRPQVRETPALALSSPAITGSSPREVETAAVQDVLERYRASHSTLSTAGIQFQSCGVELFEGGRATARCRGRAIVVPKGNRSERVEVRAWSFQLSRVNDGWAIVSVDSR